MTDLELAWLAGLLEGEGSFLAGPPSDPKRPRVALQMTDEDVVVRASTLLGIRYFPTKRHVGRGWKPNFQLVVKGGPAVELMQRLRPLMGKRRQEQIDAAVASHRRTINPNGSGHKLSAEMAAAIREELSQHTGRLPGGVLAELAERHGVSKHMIGGIRRGRYWP